MALLKCVVFSALVVMALADYENVNAFSKFQEVFGKFHTSMSEHVKRAAIFNANLDYINKHNAKNLSFQLGVNQFADLTNAEFRELYLRPVNISKKNPAKSILRAGGNNPASVDWRTKGCVTPVKDQGQCGSCWSFSTCASFESAWCQSSGKLVSFSEQNLVDCSKKQGNQGCNGGLVDDAFQYIIDNGGLDTEASYKYTARDGTCKYKSADSGGTLSSFTDVEQNSEAALETASATIGTISIAIDASHNSFQFYKSGVYIEPDCSSTDLDHAVAVVGYGELSGAKYWIVRNSWASTWGLDGYILMAKDHDNQCGVANSASYPVI